MCNALRRWLAWSSCVLSLAVNIYAPNRRCLVRCTTYDTQSSALFRLKPVHAAASLRQWIIALAPNVSAAMGDASKSSQMLRDQAARCRRLARATTDATVSQRLLELAAEFEKQANALEPSPCR